MTAFLHFVNDTRAEFKEKNPELSHKVIVSKLSEKWRELTDNEKEPFDIKAKLDRDNYIKRKEAYEAEQKELKQKEENANRKKSTNTEDGENPVKKHKKSTENSI